MITKYSDTTLEDELRKAFRNSGYGNVDVKVERFRVGAGYGIETYAEFWIKVMKSSLTRKDTSRASNKLYKIVRRGPRK